MGVVIGAQGLKGAVRVKCFTETPEALGAYGALHLKDGRTLAIVSLRVTAKGEAVVEWEGVSGREAAEALKGAELFVAREALPVPVEGEFYHADLVGLEAQDSEGRLIGTVSAIHDFGAGDVIEIRRDGADSVLFPFTDETVPRIEIAKGFIVIAVPEDDEPEHVE